MANYFEKYRTPAPLRGFAQSAVSGIGGAAKGLATGAHELLSAFDTEEDTPEAGASRLKAVQDNPVYAWGQAVQQAAKELYPVSAEEEGGLLTKAGRAAGGFLPLIASGPAAPITVGLQSMGDKLEKTFSDQIAEGKDPDEAAEHAFNQAKASGGFQAALFAVAPEPLRKLGDKMIVDKFGRGVVTKFLAGRVAQATEGAAIGGASQAGENVIEGKPVLENTGPASVGMAAVNALTPRSASTSKLLSSEELPPEATKPLALPGEESPPPEAAKPLSLPVPEETPTAGKLSDGSEVPAATPRDKLLATPEPTAEEFWSKIDEKVSGLVHGGEGPSKPELHKNPEAWADAVIAESRSMVNAGANPELLTAYVIKGSVLIGRGVKDFAQWSTEMVKQFGEGIKDQLETIYEHASKHKLTPSEFLTEAVADPAENLRMKANKRPGTGVAKNPFTRFEDQTGRPIHVGADPKTGGKRFDAWIEENEKWLTPEEIDKASKWYKEVLPKFVDEFGPEQGPTKLMAWLAAQQNVSPGGALGNVFKAEDKLAGVGTGKNAGLAEDKVIGILTNRVPEKGFGGKLADFSDAGFERPTRTYMGGEPSAGGPFVADIHSGRDSGFVDPQTLNRLVEMSDNGDLFINGKPVTAKVTETKTTMEKGKPKTEPIRVSVKGEGMKSFSLIADQTASPGGSAYEGISEWGNNLTKHLNDIKWQGRTWEPAEAQAVGWMRTLRQYGLPEGTVAGAMQENTGRVYAEVNYSSGALLPQTMPEFAKLPLDVQHNVTQAMMERIVPQIAKTIGGSLRVRGISFGDGVFGGERAPSAAIEVMGSAEAVQMFAAALGHASEQAATMSITFGPGGAQSRAIRFRKKSGGKFNQSEMESLFKEAGVGGFSVHQLPGGTEGLITGAKKDFTPKGFSEKAAAAMGEKVSEWGLQKGLDLDVENVAARVTAHANDWKAQPEGEGYRKVLESSGIGRKIPDILDFRRQWREALSEVLAARVPEGGTARGPAGAAATPAAPLLASKKPSGSVLASP